MHVLSDQLFPNLKTLVLVPWSCSLADGLGTIASSIYACISPREFGVGHRLPCGDQEGVLHLQLCKISGICCRRFKGLLINFEIWSFHSFYLSTMHKSCLKNVATFCSVKMLQTLSILSQQSICHIKSYKTLVPQTPFYLDREGINNLVNNQSQTQKKVQQKSSVALKAEYR